MTASAFASTRRFLLSASAQRAVAYGKYAKASSRLFSTEGDSDARPSPYIQGNETHFGFQSVGINEKEAKVRQVFESVADSYDVMNDVMSAGMHRYWKDYLLDLSAVSSMAKAVRKFPGSELRILDVAGGTGDVAFRFIEAAECQERSKSSGHDAISVTVCDINQEMLRVGEKRARERFGSALLDDSKALSFVEGNAQSLQFSDNAFDVYTIAFGLRNVTDVDKGLREAYRVLKPGGRFMCLEFSQIPNPVLQQIYDGYSFNVIPGMGELIANDRASYQYLVESIRKFSDQEELIARLNLAGFKETKYTNLTGGIVAIHEGWKPIE
jgi:ubiquinone/menaquinone biosynthesis methyltransferase